MSRNRFPSLSLLFLAICLGTVLGILGNAAPGAQEKLERLAAFFGLPYGWFWVVSTVLLISLVFVVTSIKEWFDSTDKVAKTYFRETKEEKVRRRFLTDLYDRYQKRCKHKLDGRYEIPLIVSDETEGFRIQQFEEAATYIIRRYERKGRLLLAGSRGSGKTMLLLKLAKHLTKKAQQDASQPVPVIFNLASWSRDYTHFNDWVAAMLTKGYGLSSKDARHMLEKRGIVYLLDGLDELARYEKDEDAAEVRRDCLNSLHSALTHGSMGVVICCRPDELNLVRQQPGLQPPWVAVLKVKDLEPLQIEHALTAAGGNSEDRFAAPNLQAALNADGAGVYLQVISNPFYFTTALQVFDSTVPPHVDASDKQGLEFNLIEAFIKKKLEDTKNPRRFARAGTLHWLTWLARFLSGRVTFELSDLQPSILRRKWLYRVLFSLFFGFFGGLVMGLYSRMLVPGVVFGTLYSLISVYMITENFGRWMLEPLRRWRMWVVPFLFGVVASIASASLILIARVKQGGVLNALNMSAEQFLLVILMMLLAWLVAFVASMVVRLIIRVLVGIAGSMPLSNIQTEDFGHWTLGSLLHRPAWRNILRSGIEGGVAGLFIVIMICIIGLSVFLIYLTYHVMKGNVLAPNLAEMFAGLIVIPFIIILGLIGFPIGFIIGLLLGILRACRETARFVSIHSPYQRLRAGIIFNILQLVLVGWSLLLLERVSNLPQYLRGSLEFRVSSSLFLALLLFVIFGLIGLFRTPLFKHLTLRVCLTMEGVMPLRYAAFLEYATALGVLERDGGQWRFRHEILQEHFARCQQDDVSGLTQTR